MIEDAIITTLTNQGVLGIIVAWFMVMFRKDFKEFREELQEIGHDLAKLLAYEEMKGGIKYGR